MNNSIKNIEINTRISGLETDNIVSKQEIENLKYSDESQNTKIKSLTEIIENTNFGINIKGTYNTLEELQNAHPEGNENDAYLVLNELYIWDLEKTEWMNIGTIKGPSGKDGEGIPIGGTQGQVIKMGSDGQAIWGEDKDTTYSKATTETDGLMSKEDKLNLYEVNQKTNNLENEDISINQKIDIIVDCLTNLAEVESESIYLDDSSNEECIITLKGNSKQETRTGKNKFNKSTATKGVYISADTGQTVVSANYFASDFIKIKQNINYIWNDDIRTNAGALYDSNKNFIEGIKSKITFNSNSAYYVRMTGALTNIDKYQLEEGTIGTSYEEFGIMPSIEFTSNLKNTGDNINEFDKNNVKVLDAFLDTNTIVANANYKTYYIECEKNQDYVIQREGTSSIYLAYADSLPTTGETIQGRVQGTTIKTGTNAKYLLVQVYRNTYDTLQTVLDTLKIEKGIVSTEYSKFGEGCTKVIACNKNSFNSKKWYKIEQGQGYPIFSPDSSISVEFIETNTNSVKFKQKALYCRSFK